ncbi:MAG: NAD(P)-binding protein [Betaproteobacteria bacterium]|nr:NAD(P)-binding protein [Betaproteobacteria bacterium]
MAAIGHVGVVGAGLAGLAAALAAAAAGLRVDVFEAVPVPFAPQAHIDVVPNLLRDLAALGVGEACVRRGFPYHGLAVLDGDGRLLHEIATPPLAGAPFPSCLGMVYGDLLGLLRDAAVAHGARLHLGCAVTDVAAGEAIVTADGQRHGVDLALVASGSRLPALASLPARPMALDELPQQWCHALLPRPPMLERTLWLLGTGSTKAMVVPVDARRAGIAVLQPLGASSTAAAMRATLAGQGRLLQSLGALWKDGTPSLVRPVRSGLLEGPWHEQGVLRIGHSAHVLPPHFGQAAAQAVEDAVVLGDLLRLQLSRDEMLQAFMARRGERARQVHAVATQAARWDLRPEAATDLPALAAQLAQLVAGPA